MKLEIEPLQLKKLKVSTFHNQYQLSDGPNHLSLDQINYQIYDFLQSGKTISMLVQHFFQKGWVVSFRRVYDLIMELHELNWIQNTNAQIELNQILNRPSGEHTEKISTQGLSLNKWTKPDPAEVIQFKKLVSKSPLFRNLQQEYLEYFFQDCELAEFSPTQFICKAGDNSRDLFTVLDGELAIVRPLQNGQRQFVADLEKGAIFGEGAYFLGVPRSADVITRTKTRLLKFKYSKSRLDEVFNQQRSAELQHRVWIINGLLQSDLFARIPPESFDACVFWGKPYSVAVGTSICREGEVGNSFFILIQGEATAYQNGKPIRKMQTGSPFGEIALLASQGRRTASVVAGANCLIVQITGQDFFQFLSKNLRLAYEIETLAWNRWESDQKRKAA